MIVLRQELLLVSSRVTLQSGSAPLVRGGRIDDTHLDQVLELRQIRGKEDSSPSTRFDHTAVISGYDDSCR